MEKNLVVIKLKDQVRIPKSPPVDLLLGSDFYTAQDIILMNRMGLQPNDTLQYEEALFSFFKTYNTLNLGVPLASLYYLADIKAYASNMKIVWNFLSYFTFVCKKDDLATLDLSALLSNDAVDFWWLEGPMLLCNDVNQPALPQLPTVNTYYDSLDFQRFQQQFPELSDNSTVGNGKGVAIVDCEDYGNQLQHSYLPAFQSERIRVVDPHNIDIHNKPHFYQTVGMIFAVPPSPLSSSDENIMGIAPKAQLIAVPFGSTPVLHKDFIEFIHNFITRARANLLDNAQLKRGDILLFERMVSIPMGSGVYRNLPLEVLPDMRNAMQDYDQHGIVVIQPAGQSNHVNTDTFDLDSAFLSIQNLHTAQTHNLPNKPTYTDFSDGSVCIIVGAWDTENETILKDTNSGTIVDVYLWGVGIRTLTAPDAVTQTSNFTLFGPYGFTSAASAIAAGIVACLQSAAKADGKTLTTAQFKDIFNRTFRAGGASVFESTTLDKLWQVCKVVMSGSTF